MLLCCVVCIRLPSKQRHNNNQKFNQTTTTAATAAIVNDIKACCRGLTYFHKHKPATGVHIYIFEIWLNRRDASPNAAAVAANAYLATKLSMQRKLGDKSQPSSV